MTGPRTGRSHELKKRDRKTLSFSGAAAAIAAAAFAMLMAGCAKQDWSVPADLLPVRLAAVPAPAPAPTIAPRPVFIPPVPAPEPVRPAARVVPLGHSVQGRPLVMYVFGDGGPTTLVFGGIHGSEPTSVDVAVGLIEYLTLHPDLAAGKCVAVLAAANPDGLAVGTRTNCKGVDLNRNFPASNWRRIRQKDYTTGDRPASEPETNAIMSAVNLSRPDRIVSIHSARSGGHCNNYDGPAADLARLMYSYNGYPVKPSIGYPTPGSFGTWAGIDRRIPTITLELPAGQSGQACWQQNREALLEVIRSQPALGK